MKKKAAIHNPYWDSMGGGERYTAAFAALLLKLGWEVDILWPKSISEAVMNRFGIDISAAFVGKKFSPLGSLNYGLVFWLSDGSLPTSLASKTIIHFQFPFQGVSGKKFTNLLKTRIYDFVSNSEYTRSFVDKEFAIKSRVIYPPVDVSSFTPASKTDTIIYVGRFSHLTQLKNPDLLIKAFKNINARLPGWELILAGGVGVGTPAGEIARLQKLAKGYPIKIITNPTLTELKRLYSRAKIFWSASGMGANEIVNPLQVEHFGITVVEAMAAECLPIIPDLGGHREIVRSKIDGFLYRSLKELQDTTVDLACHPEKLHLLSKSAGKRSKMFDVSHFESRFMELL